MNNRKIKMYISLYEHLLLLYEPLVTYLSSILPATYKESWWEYSIVNAFKTTQTDNMKQKYKKERKLKELLKYDMKTLESFDFSDLLEILIYNWKKINNDVAKRQLFYKLKEVRNDISHPNENKPISKKFKSYVAYIIDFAKIINAENVFINKLEKYIRVETDNPKNGITEEEKRKKLLELVETSVIDPALNCDKLNDDIKESLIRTLIRFEIAETIDDINAFFKGALGSSRGEEIYKHLHKNNLKAFENIREEFNRIYLA
jgi:hypothetical protein